MNLQRLQGRLLTKKCGTSLKVTTMTRDFCHVHTFVLRPHLQNIIKAINNLMNVSAIAANKSRRERSPFRLLCISRD